MDECLWKFRHSLPTLGCKIAATEVYSSIMKKRYQVFISSTFQDLQPARQEVSQALLRSNCFPAGMELFPAADEEQFTYIKEIIDESDYYIIISAGRYGSIEPETGLSYTELEYDYALRREKAIVRLLHADPFNELRGEFIEKTDFGRKKLEAFRDKLKSGRLVRFWREPKELGIEVVHGIEDAKKRRPAKGWVRAESNSLSYDELRDSVISMSKALRVGTDVFLDRFPNPVARINANFEVLYANDSAKKLSLDHIDIGANIAEIATHSSKPIEDIITLTKNGNIVREFFSFEIDGESKSFELSLSKLDDMDGSILVVINDMTELKELEVQFVQSQKMQAIGQLAGGVAHDFNNLLTAISGHCDLLLLHHDEGDQSYPDLVQIHQNANRAAALVGQLLAFSRKQTLRPEVLCLNDVLADLSHLLNRLVGEKIQISQIVSANHFVRADRRGFEQVIMNLVVNSRDAMPDGGEIMIKTQNLSLQSSKVIGRAAIASGRYISIKVIDPGIGIPSENLDKIFEPFFTTKRTGEGTGLGLSTAYGIVKQSGGYIFADSLEGSGAILEILLPAVDAPMADVKAVTPVRLATKTESSGEARGTIVLAEDEAPVRAFAARALRLRGFEVLEAADGTEAISVLGGSRSDVVGFVSDVVMPKMDGPTWVEKALELHPDTPVLFISGYAQEGFWNRIEHLPNFRFLKKPFSLAELVNEIHLLLNAGGVK